MSRNSDSKDVRRSKNFKIYTDNNGFALYTGLPYSDLEHDPLHDMSQVNTNQYGVSMSATQTIQNNARVLSLDPPSQNGSGVNEANIPALVMPTATSAQNGIRILGQAIEDFGVNDPWGFGVIIGDSREVWYLETLSGHQWVAIRIPDTMYFVAANGPGQIQGYEPEKYTYLLSHYLDQSPIRWAQNTGIAKYDHGIFNFRTTFADVQPSSDRISQYIRIAYAQHWLNPSTRPFNQAIIDENSFPMFLTPEKPISIATIKALQSSHYADVPEYDPYLSGSSHPQYRPIANLRASNAHITEISPTSDPRHVSLSNVEYIALGMPTLSVYLPIYYGLTEVPEALQHSTHEADDDSLFWQFRKIQVLAFLNDPLRAIPYDFPRRKAYIQKKYNVLTQSIAEQQRLFMEEYIRNPRPELINDFTRAIVNAVSRINQQLIHHFMRVLDVDHRYGLTTHAERNLWFTRIAKEQECHYRTRGEVACHE